jgi:hypothetical protein
MTSLEQELWERILPQTSPIALRCGEACRGCESCGVLCQWVQERANEELWGVSKKAVRAVLWANELLWQAFRRAANRVEPSDVAAVQAVPEAPSALRPDPAFCWREDARMLIGLFPGQKMGVTRTDHVVTRVLPGSVAASLGIRPGDHLEKLDWDTWALSTPPQTLDEEAAEEIEGELPAGDQTRHAPAYLCVPGAEPCGGSVDNEAMTLPEELQAAAMAAGRKHARAVAKVLLTSTSISSARFGAHELLHAEMHAKALGVSKEEVLQACHRTSCRKVLVTR